MNKIKTAFAEEISALLMNYHKLNPIQKTAIKTILGKIGLGCGKSKIKYAQKISKNALHSYRKKCSCVNEHMVPKQKYILDELINLAERQELTMDKILSVINDYLNIAFITSEENKKLPTRTNMPKEWDGVDIFARYNDTDIELIDFDDNLRQQLKIKSIDEISSEIRNNTKNGKIS